MPESENTNADALLWWVKLGFPAFDAGPDGFPRQGQVIRHFRQTRLKADGKPWTQRDLAQVLGKQELAIRDMELRDTGLNDISRRRFLAHLFDIPPLLLGLATPTHLSKKSSQGTSAPEILIVSDQIDLEEVRARLTGFWTQNDGASQDMFLSLDTTLKRFYERYPTTAFSERLEVVTALCELHIHAANLLRDRGKFSKSLEHLNKTKDLNMLLKEDELQADVLYRRGGLYLEKGEISLALADYHAAEQKLANVSAPLQAAVLLETALSEARIATSKQQRTAVLKKLDRAGRIIRVEQTEAGREKWPYLKVDLARYHLDRVATLIVIGCPEEAQQELKLLSFSQLTGRRSVYYLILQAQACFGLKEYAQAAMLAEEALPLARTMRSRVNLERIKTLYKQFQNTPFRNNPEVGRLGYLLYP
jgi:tetratricopeptide (TPR) repeat protein